jgi:hypothetical protein
MTRINLFRANAVHTAPSTFNSVAWGKTNHAQTSFDNTSTLIFAALLIACSLAVGCSSEKPKPVSSTNQFPITQPMPPITTSPAPALQAAAKPVHKRVIRKVAPTVTYVDDASGVSFQYPRSYALKTSAAATELVSSSPIPMDFVQPGGTALAAVAVPDSIYPNSDLASAFFNVSVNKTLTADQCGEFSVAQPNPATPADPAVQATAQVFKLPLSKLMIGDMELQSAETNAAQGRRKEVSKYYHVFQNGACYEFAIKVATTELPAAPTAESTTKAVDPDEVFQRLEKILATVKINPVTAPEVNSEVKTNIQPPTETPAQ